MGSFLPVFQRNGRRVSFWELFSSRYRITVAAKNSLVDDKSLARLVHSSPEDTPALNELIREIGRRNGIVVFKPGVYIIDGRSLQVDISNVELIFEAGSIVRRMDYSNSTSPIVMVGGDLGIKSVIIRNLDINGAVKPYEFPREWSAIHLRNVHNSILSNIRAYNYGWNGLLVEESTGNTFENIEANGGTADGFYLYKGSNDNIIKGLTGGLNLGALLFIWGSSRNKAYDLISNTNYEHGIAFSQGANENLIERASISLSRRGAIRFERSDGNILKDIFVKDSCRLVDDGLRHDEIYFSTSRNNRFSKVVIEDTAISEAGYQINEVDGGPNFLDGVSLIGTGRYGGIRMNHPESRVSE